MNMAKELNTITVEVVGSDDEAGAVFLTEFRQFCDALEACLKRAESLATGRVGRVAYKVAKLATGSANMTLVAVRRGSGRDARPQSLRMFRKTITAIQRGKGLDPRIGPDDVVLFRKLATPLSRGSKSVVIDAMEITSQYMANADKILSESTAQEGTVSGLLEKLNVHETCEFILFPPIDGYKVTCIFQDSMLESVRSAIKHNVTVFGVMRYHADSPFPRVVHVASMEIHPDDEKLPTLAELRGLSPGCIGELTSVEFVRGLRND